MRKIILVYASSYTVLLDYISSLNIIDKTIELSNFSIEVFLQSNNIYIFTQMWFKLEMFPEELYLNDRFIYLNVEMLTEQNRWQNIYNLIQKGIRIADYSLSNIAFIKEGLRKLNQDYPHEILHFPYQYNIKEIVFLENKSKEYDYDIGVINAFPQKSNSVNSSLFYKRSILFEKLQEMKVNCINILGWGQERDDIIRRCKIILNVHHFECFNIFEHIRCDRLIFANKIVISENSLYSEDLDIDMFIIWKKYDDIIDYAKHVLDNFDIYQRKITNMNKDCLIINRINGLRHTYSKVVTIKNIDNTNK
jgi:hypothetical protein